MPNVKVTALCDVDERLFPRSRRGGLRRLQDTGPDTEIDIRRLLERKDVDAISIATPDYWHALMTIWGCQAGKECLR